MVENLLMYLRKSRADNPSETVEEVLSKHERILQDFCLREYGEEIPEDQIYREVVSGESIADRVEIKKVLSLIERPEIRGIVVIEPQRLSRGDLIDCGRLIQALQYTKTLVITPVITYDLDNKMARRFFQDELMRGRDYLDYVKEILMRGKLASVNRGCYLASSPPYGYDRVRIGKDWTLKPNPDSEVVQMIFRSFADGIGSGEICRKLNALGIPSPTGRAVWVQATIDKMLRNKHYIGKIVYQYDRTTVTVIDGEKVTRRIRQADGDYLVVEGKHPAIIDQELFDRCQKLLSLRPPLKNDTGLRNAFAGIAFCGNCGKLLTFKQKSNQGQYIACKTLGCSKSVKYQVFYDAVVSALERSELPELIARYNNGDAAGQMRKTQLKALEKDLEDLKAQEETQYELLETRRYTQEVFDRRNAVLREKMKEAEKKIARLRRDLPAAIDYGRQITTLSSAIRSLRDETPNEDRNLLLKTIIERITYTADPYQPRGVCDFSLNIELKL